MLDVTLKNTISGMKGFRLSEKTTTVIFGLHFELILSLPIKQVYQVCYISGSPTFVVINCHSLPQESTSSLKLISVPLHEDVVN